MANLDPSLAHLLWEKEQFEKNPSLGAHPVPDDREIPIGFTFTGEFANIAALGFKGTPSPSGTAFGNVDIPTLRALAAHPQVVQISHYIPPGICLDKSIPDIEANQVWNRSGSTFTGYTGKNTILGIIDTGIDFTHPVFKDPSTGKSRILWIWDQTFLPALSNPPLPTEHTPGPIDTPLLGTNVYTLGYGVDYSNDDINNTLNNPSHPVCRHKDVGKHGTHVAGIAGGNGQQGEDCEGAYHYIGVAPEASFIIVRLWGLSPGDSGENLTPPTNIASPATGARNVVTDAVAYILSKAKPKTGTWTPVAINCSFGYLSSNQMNANNPLVVEIEGLLRNANANGVGISFAAGNYAAEGWHIQVSVPAGGSLDVPLKIPTGDKLTRNLTFYYTGATIQTSITSPFPTSTLVAAGTPNATANGAGSSVSVNDTAGTSTIGISPPMGGVNVSGTWVAHLNNTGGAAVTIDGFCENTAKRDGFKFTNQAQWNPLQTMSAYANGTLSISTGNYAVADHTLASLSSRGPTRDATPANKPDLCAPGENIRSAGKTPSDCDCCCACCQNWYIPMSGTSMASPHVAGTMALMLNKNPQLTSADMRTILTNSSNLRAVPPAAPPNDVAGWGAGQLDAKLVVGAVMPINAPVEEPAIIRAPEEAVSLQQEFLRTPNGNTLAGLFQRHFPEIMDLINHNRRVATIWHRVKGPVWTRLAAQAFYNPALKLRPEIDGLSLTEAALRFLEILKQYASATLLGEIAPYEHLLAGFTGEMTLHEMVRIVGNYKQETAVWPPHPVH